MINNRYRFGFPFLLASVLQYLWKSAQAALVFGASESLLGSTSYNWLFTLDDLKMVLILARGFAAGVGVDLGLIWQQEARCASGGERARHAGEQSASPIKAAGKAKPLPVLNVRKPTGVHCLDALFAVASALMLKPYAVIGVLTATAAVGVPLGRS